MKSKEEIEKSANEFSKDYIKTTSNSILQSTFKLEVGYIKGYTQCQEDTKQILLDFIKWSNAIDEYGNKLDKIDVDNFLNKQD